MQFETAEHKEPFASVFKFYTSLTWAKITDILPVLSADARQLKFILVINQLDAQNPLL